MSIQSVVRFVRGKPHRGVTLKEPGRAVPYTFMTFGTVIWSKETIKNILKLFTMFNLLTYFYNI